MATPNPAATKKTPNISAPAAGFHLTQAESASASKAKTRIQTHDPKKMPQPRLALSCSQVQPSSRYACKKNKRRPGTQVMKDIRTTRIHILPRTYSTREKGRAR